MYHFNEGILNLNGDALVGHFVQALDPVSGAVVPIFADGASTPIIMASGKANMAKVNSNGMADFYVASTTGAGYTLTIYGPDGVTVKETVRDVKMDSYEGPAGPPGTAGPPGANGPAGSNSGLSALFTSAAGMTIAAPIIAIDLGGYSTAGVGSARYVYDATVNSAYVTANPRTAFLAADGRGFRLDLGQRLTAEMFGVIPNDVTKAAANQTAFLAAFNWRPDAGKGQGPAIHIGFGDYYIAGEIEPDGTFTIIGQDSGEALLDGKGLSRIIQTSNATTFRVRCRSTGPGGTVADGTKGYAEATLIRGVSIYYQTYTTDLDKHAIDVRAQVFIENCVFTQVPGDAIHIEGGTSGAQRFGLPNDWRVTDCFVHSARGHGLYIYGGDANGGVSIHLHTHNGVEGCGILDRSWFGCTHIGPELTGYGNKGVHVTGQLYQLIVDDPVTAAATTPGTNNAIWYPLGAGGISTNFPDWNSADASQHRLKLPYWLATPESTIIGGYQELGSVLSHGGTRLGGLHATTVVSAQMSGDATGAMLAKAGVGQTRTTSGSGHPLYPAIGTGEGTIVGGMGQSAASKYRKSYLLNHVMNGTRLYWGYGLDGEGAGTDLDLGFFNGPSLLRFTMPGTSLSFGRSVAQTGKLAMGGIFLGNPFRNPGPDNRALQFGDTWVRDQGEHARGDFVFNTAPTASGTLGWSCTTGGTPGTWTAVPVAGFSGTYTGDVTFTGNFTNIGPIAGSDTNGWGFRLAVGAGSAYFDNKNNNTNNWGYGSIYRAGDIHLFQVAPANTTNAQVDMFQIDANGARSAKNLGFRTGAGGAVTQATDKSTAVTLAKNCGQVTMNGAALAAGVAVSFTLTNSQIAATDVVNACIASGASAGAYALSVDAVAAGSCRISLRNQSGGSLSEAVVINFAVLKAVTS